MRENGKGTLSFVVQKHKATTLHYDLRLQIGDVMPSWAIPKGPTLDNTVKRLAIHTTNHLIEYGKFEGVIPEGEYGAGTVMIWDEGMYSPELEVSKGVLHEVTGTKEAQRVAGNEYREGNLKFILYGKKLQGSFALIRTAGVAGNKDSWLLIKHLDKFCKKGYDANKYDSSASSGLSFSQIR